MSFHTSGIESEIVMQEIVAKEADGLASASGWVGHVWNPEDGDLFKFAQIEPCLAIWDRSLDSPVIRSGLSSTF